MPGAAGDHYWTHLGTRQQDPPVEQLIVIILPMLQALVTMRSSEIPNKQANVVLFIGITMIKR